MYSSTASRTHHGNNIVSIRDKILYMLPFHVQLGEASSSISFTSSFYLLATSILFCTPAICIGF